MNSTVLRFLFVIGTVLAIGINPAWSADKGITSTIDHPAEAVAKAAADALAVIGISKLEKNQPDLIEGQRPRRIGAFVG